MIIIRKYTSILFLLNAVLIASSCFKQEPKEIKNKNEVVQVERLDACTRMNLFNNLLDHENIKATFKCTEWNKSFPNLYSKIDRIPHKDWNHLLLPVSIEVLNKRENLKRLIAVSQELDKKGGLVDLGNVIGALSDANFYDGLNSLFNCSSEACPEREALSKEEIYELIKIIVVLKDKNTEIHSLLAQAVQNLQLLSPGFAKDFSKVLKSDDFKAHRMEMLDLLVSVIAIEKNEFEIKLIPKLLVSSESSSNSIWAWLNSNNFTTDFLKDLIKFNEDHPNAINDLRSISQIKQQKLVCKNNESAAFFINLEKHLKDLVEVFAIKDNEEIGKYLENDLAQHQIASQACPNFKEIEVSLDRKVHKLSVLRLKKSLIEFIRIPGVLSLIKSVSKTIHNEEGFTEQIIGDMLDKYSEKNYLGSLEKFVHIINDVSPDILDDYVRFIKGMPVKAFNDLSVVLTYILKDQNHKSWNTLGKAWTFFNEQEKEFLFNYIDQHFTKNNNYIALFNYYLEIYTIAQPSLSNLIQSWILEEKIDSTYNSLKVVAKELNGEDVLSDFREFFSRQHLVKIIELFINGESLATWAQDIIDLIPKVSVNEISFNFNDTFSGSSNACLDSIISSDLDLLIRNFPAGCSLTSSSTLVGKLSLISELSSSFSLSNGYDLVSKSNFLNYEFLQSIILTLKQSSRGFMSERELSTFLDFQNEKILTEDVFLLMSKINDYIKSMPDEDQLVFKSRTLKEIASTISDRQDLGSLKAFVSAIASIHENNQWNLYQNPNVPSQIELNKCKNVLNPNIGGTVCSTKENFKEFISNFTKLLVRKNDEVSPLGARQFFKALDPGEGLPIPLGTRDPKYKNLSIKESLQMFIDFSDKREAINKTKIEYEKEDSTTDQITTLMERIEIVIRDVNFDENYLGAHYKNSVSKSFDYNTVVESKYKLFGVCVKAGFCGKFMNRREKKLARNAVRAFPSLLEANQGEFHYGDYMKALLGVVVSSSSKASQISSIVKFKKNEDGFNIPWIQTKKQLRKHNGKILSELASIAAFSNMANWTRDRFARSDQEFAVFINSKSLNYINLNLFKNISSQVSDKALVNLFEALSESSQLWDDLYTTIDSLEYKKIRQIELVFGDILTMASTLSKNQVQFNYEKVIELVTWAIDNYEMFKEYWPKQLSITNMILDLSPYTVIISDELIKNNQYFEHLIAFAAKKFEGLMFNTTDRISLFDILKNNVDNKQAKLITDIVTKSSSVLTNLGKSETRDYYKNLNAISRTINTTNLNGFSRYLTMSVNARACEQRGELIYCKANLHYLEPWKIVDYFAEDKGRWTKYIKGMINPPDEVSSWLYKSLNLIVVPDSPSGD